jgi:histidine ammonia-lyase
VLLARLVSLAQGSSGVSVALLRQLQALLRHDILPRIPAEGSVGASGDLTPLSYVAAVLCGEREVLHDGAVKPAGEALAAHGLQPLRLRPKEGLAIMNGTAVMTALACLAWQRADYLGRLATRITAFNLVASAGNAHHFDEALFAVKPHPGQQRVAAAPARGPRHGTAVAQRTAPAGSLLAALRTACHRRAAGRAAVAAHQHRERAQQRQRQPDHRRDAERWCCTAAISTAATSPSRWIR